MVKITESSVEAVKTWGGLQCALRDVSVQIQDGRQCKNIWFGSNLYRLKWTPYSELSWCRNLFTKARCWWTGANGSVSCRTYGILELKVPASDAGVPLLVIGDANPFGSFLHRIKDSFSLKKHIAIGCAPLESRSEAMVRVVHAMLDGNAHTDPRFGMSGVGISS